MNNVDVIVPVYDGLEQTTECIDSLLKTLDFSWSRLLLINDCSPSGEMSVFLRKVASGSCNVVLLENEKNVGFVETVNRGMGYDSSSDVVLVNSDTIVSNDWLFRLRNWAYSEERVGSVTPFSNNATICSFPNFCEDNPLAFSSTPCDLDACVAKNEQRFCVDIPTAVGFCMYIRRDCLNDVGYFDVDNFGKGYGEENDFSMRAIKRGWRNILATNVFVFHEGGVSFGPEKEERMNLGMKALISLHPDYEKIVHEHIAEDPAQESRIYSILSLYAGSKLPKILFVSHGLGGGVDRHIREMSTVLSGRALVLLIEPSEESKIKLSFLSGGQELQDVLIFDLQYQYEKFVSLAKLIGISHLHFHHTMGHGEQVWGLAESLGVKYDVTLHDYYYINSSPTLTDSDGCYQPEEEKVELRLPPGVTVGEWRSAQRKFLSCARIVIAPSEATKKIFSSFFPDLSIVVNYHPDHFFNVPFPMCMPPLASDRLRIGVLGAVSKEKGADLLEKVARQAAAEKLAVDFILIGYAYRPLKGVAIIHGPYDESDLDKLIELYLLDAVWFPAQCPETFSYTLTSALKSGLPIIAPRLGAFIDRLEGRPQTHFTEEFSVGHVLGVLRCANRKILDGEVVAQWDQVEAGNIYPETYLSGIAVKSAVVGEEFFEMISKLEPFFRKNRQHKSVAESVLLLLFKLRGLRYFSGAARLVPFSVQRRIKKWLSERPIHEILD